MRCIFRVMLIYFWKGKKGSARNKKICAVYGYDVITESIYK